MDSPNNRMQSGVRDKVPDRGRLGPAPVQVLRAGVLVVILVATAAHSAEDPVASLKKGQPKVVADLIDRIVECNHWGGEEAYDAERREQIRSAVAKLRCDMLDADEEKLLATVGKEVRIRQAISAARKLFL
jgi:hypothetical protein